MKQKKTFFTLIADVHTDSDKIIYKGFFIEGKYLN